jgi:hypothetical protein
MKCFLVILLSFLSFISFSQSTINGLVKDKKGEPVFAVNVYLKSYPQKGTITDFGGNFNLIINNLDDTLLVSYIGYETKVITLSTIDMSKSLIIVLNKNSQTLEEVIIKARDPISEKFSVVKMEKMDIYFNPVSQGDPLKAITVLPASTSTNETANPSLRGSSADRTRVILNGVPIYNPVRASQLNNQGFFSLFNPEIINRQYVYASNPPLTYGNTSAGLVEIQTIKSLETNQLQLSTSLASVGLFLSQKIKKEVSFIQIYGNYQFSDAFVGIQKDKLPNIKNFYTKDAGINFHTKIGKKAEFNSYNYFIDEQFNGYNQQFTYKGNVVTDKRRIFTVNNLKLYSEKGVLSINSGTNNSKQQFSFGNIKSGQKISQVYSSIDYKWHLLENTNVQLGISQDFHRNKFKDSIPTNYFALSPNSPNYYSETSNHNQILEAYLYTNWNINDKITFSTGIRSNLPVENQKYYFSSQLGLKYRLNKNQSFLLSGGKYHNYSIPNYYSKTYNLLSSYQVALDYSYEFKNTLLKAGTYFKNETGEQSANAFFTADKVNTFGIEFYLEHNFYKSFKFTFSNSFIDQKMRIFENDYHGSKDFNYLVKTTIQYNNPKLFSLALTYLSRPGAYYNEITGSTFDNQTSFYKPIFSNDLYNLQYGNYNRFDISLSKYIRMRNNALITFISINNIFNTKNENSALYAADYANKDFDFYQFRTVYFGLVWQLNY